MQKSTKPMLRLNVAKVSRF